MNEGRSLELYFVDGNPEGMLTAEVFNWTGHVLRIPRTRLVDGLKRDHARQTGVYLLLGEDEQGSVAYVGESEDVAKRIRDHDAKKDWWDSVVIITTAGDALHKAHVKYLESRLVELALSAGITRLENGNAPPRSSLNEAALANMESFLRTLQMVLPAIRVDLLQSRKRQVAEQAAVETSHSLALDLTASRKGVKASAILVNGEIIVKAGSHIVSSWVGNKKYHTNLQKKHSDLLASDVVELGNTLSTFKQDYAFSSPSAAAAVVLGRTANGRLEWKLPDGRTYAEWEDAQLGISEGDDA